MADPSLPVADNLFLVQRLLGISNGSTDCSLSSSAKSKFWKLFNYHIILVNVNASTQPQNSPTEMIQNERFAVSTINLSRLPATIPQNEGEWGAQIFTQVAASENEFHRLVEQLAAVVEVRFMLIIDKNDNTATIEAKEFMFKKFNEYKSAWRLKFHTVFAEAVRHVLLHTSDIDVDDVLRSIQPAPFAMQNIHDRSCAVLSDLIRAAVATAEVCGRHTESISKNSSTASHTGAPTTVSSNAQLAASTPHHVQSDHGSSDVDNHDASTTSGVATARQTTPVVNLFQELHDLRPAARRSKRDQMHKYMSSAEIHEMLQSLARGFHSSHCARGAGSTSTSTRTKDSLSEHGYSSDLGTNVSQPIIFLSIHGGRGVTDALAISRITTHELYSGRPGEDGERWASKIEHHRYDESKGIQELHTIIHEASQAGYTVVLLGCNIVDDIYRLQTKSSDSGRLRTILTLDLEDLSSESDLRPYLPRSMRPGRNGRMRMLGHVFNARRWLALLLDVVARFVGSRHYAECATEAECRAIIYSARSATALTDSTRLGIRDNLEIHRQMQRQYLCELLRTANPIRQFLGSGATTLDVKCKNQISVPKVVNDVTNSYKTRNQELDKWLWAVIKRIDQKYPEERPRRKTAEYDQLAQIVSDSLPASVVLDDAIICIEENYLDRITVTAFFELFYAVPEHAFEGDRERHDDANCSVRYVLRLLQKHLAI